MAVFFLEYCSRFFLEMKKDDTKSLGTLGYWDVSEQHTELRFHQSFFYRCPDFPAFDAIYSRG